VERVYTYDAFISYRHTKLDTAVADKLQRLLEQYVPPATATGGKHTRKLRIFRDTTELPTSSNLSGDIRTALENSRFLIVLCSKTTAQSKWCMQEITYFKELHGGRTDKILTVLTEGEPSEVFPVELRTETRNFLNPDGTIRTEVVDIEPLAANVIAPTQRQSLRKLNREFLRIAAPIYGCGYDVLYNRNQRRFVRRVVGISAVVMVLLVAFIIYTSVMLFQISAQRDELQERHTEMLIQESRYLSREAIRLLEVDDRISAIHTALAAMPTEDNPRTWTPQAEFALSQAVYAYRRSSIRGDRRLEHFSPVEQATLSRDGTRLVSRDTLNNLYIWDAFSGERIGFFSANADFSARGFAICDNNRVFVSTILTLVCIDANTGEVIWVLEHDVVGGVPIFGHHVILSHDGTVAALISTSDIVFVCTINGEMLFHKSPLAGELFFHKMLSSNGRFSTDDRFFYVGAGEMLISLHDEPLAGSLFRVDMETQEVAARPLDDGSRVLGIYANEGMVLFAVAGYGGSGRDVLLAYSRDTNQQLWEYVLSTNASFRADAFIYAYNDIVFVSSGSAVVVVDAISGELIVDSGRYAICNYITTPDNARDA